MVLATIRRGTKADVPAIQTVNLAAFRPIDESFERMLGPQVYPLLYPDWETSQQDELAELIDRPNVILFVAETESGVVGFTVVELNDKTQVGELSLLAVHPDSRCQGIGAMLNQQALQVMREAGMKLAELGTGADQAHAAARRSYERAGYSPLPLVRYYKAL